MERTQIHKEDNRIRLNNKFADVTAKGVHIFTVCDASSRKARELEARIENNVRWRAHLLKTGGATRVLLRELWEEYRVLIDRLHENFKVEELVIENITTTVGRSVLAQRLGGDTTYTGIVNYTALGDDNTAAVVGDATLGNETYRKAISSGTDAANIAYLETFFTASETSGTFEEYGMFIDGTGSADTGQLFNRFTSTVVKSLTETLNVQSIITFNDA